MKRCSQATGYLFSWKFLAPTRLVAKLIVVAVAVVDTSAFQLQPLMALNVLAASNENCLLKCIEKQTIGGEKRPSCARQQWMQASPYHSFGTKIRQKEMVVFRPPSRHTYGFVGDLEHYDLPRLELSAIINHVVGIHTEFQFIPVQYDLLPPLSGYSGNCSVLHSPDIHDSHQPAIGPKKSKKKLCNKDLSRRVQSLYWIEGDVPTASLVKAASRAILTHATFLIDESFHFSEEVWSNVDIGELCCSNYHRDWFHFHVDVIDVTNPNISLKEKSALIRKISFLFCNEQRTLSIRRDSVTSEDSVLLYHSIWCEKDKKTIHCIHFGRRTAMGPAGTRGAPSQTLRRTHRGILKEYALKDTMFASSFAMEPEIGFLMANLALASKRSHDAMKKQLALSCLDPCCGSGSLLLYSAALGATDLVGVDSDPSVWEGAMEEFKKHTPIADFIDSSINASLPYPTFVEGDIFDPMMTREFDAIVCDPPYNIGTPIFVNKTDCRPKNYHRKSEPVKFFAQGDISISDRCGAQNITLALLLLASRVLVEGGRVVFFDPVKGSPTSSSVTSYEATMQSVGLTLIFQRKQSFSPTFSRWLVCMEKCA
ncbi:hypothetical protein ACHAW6_013751 [Cyclotella cf. meneghiniana]